MDTDKQTKLLQALFLVQGELKDITLKKTADNPFFHSKYVALPQVLDVVLPKLDSHNLVLMQLPSIVDGQPALRTVIADKNTGEQLYSEMLLMLKSDDPQAQGSAITYARRYAIMSMFNLVGAEDDDDGQRATDTATHQQMGGTQTSNRPAQPKKEYPASDAQRKLMLNTIMRKGFDTHEAETILCNMAEAETVDQVTKSQASQIIDQLFSSSQADLRQWLQQDIDAA